MNYKFEDNGIKEKKEKFIIKFRDPLKLDYNEKDVIVTLYEIKSGKNMKFVSYLEEEREYTRARVLRPPFSLFTLNYLDSFAGEKHVFHRICRVATFGEKDEFLTLCGKFGYKSLNIKKSKEKGKYIWNYHLGSIRKEYEAILNHLEKNEKLRKEIDWTKEELWTINDCDNEEKVGPHNRKVLQNNPKYKEKILYKEK